jgi:hypothetical protein
MTSWDALLLGATALHAGFQLTVTVLVYPALAGVPVERWAAAHGRHSRAITPLVGLVYAAVLVACVGATATDPAVGTWVADAGTGLALLVTATLAAPTHGRLADGPDPALLRRLRRVDRVRCAGAVLAVLGSLAALTR